MVKCSNTVEEPTASVFTVANVVKVDGEAIQGKNCDTQSSFRVSEPFTPTKGSPKPMGAEISKNGTFFWLHQWDK